MFVLMYHHCTGQCLAVMAVKTSAMFKCLTPVPVLLQTKVNDVMIHAFVHDIFQPAPQPGKDRSLPDYSNGLSKEQYLDDALCQVLIQCNAGYPRAC